ncbi:MAG: aminotransferase class I/II-fold pyridoxal phosphate-dependent enzyme [Bdellovibrionota bacterium]
MYFFDEKELEALRALAAKKKFFRYQNAELSECEIFENNFSKHINVGHSLLVNSGTNALLLALLAGKIQPGDEVLIPAYTFVATAAAVVMAGAIPIIVNIDTQLSMDFEDAAKKITLKTKAVILVHMDGLVANVMAAKTFCEKNKILFIEDTAQAIGGTFKKKHLGTFGSFGCFSLNESKIISCGEGGILCTDNKDAFQSAFVLHDTPVQFSPSKKLFLEDVKTYIGHSMRVSEIQGVIMQVQLSRLEKILAILRERKKIITSELAGRSIMTIPIGFCADGDCGTAIHFQFSSIEQTLNVTKALRAQGLAFAPVTARPAHASWKWSHLFGEQGGIQPSRNPFLLSDQKYEYSNSEVLASIDILSRTIKMDIDLHLSMEETLELTKKIQAAFGNIA